MVQKCNCKNMFQDERYGKGLRVCNPTTKDGVVRCSVCGSDIRYKDEKEKKEPAKK